MRLIVTNYLCTIIEIYAESPLITQALKNYIYFSCCNVINNLNVQDNNKLNFVQQEFINPLCRKYCTIVATDNAVSCGPVVDLLTLVFIFVIFCLTTVFIQPFYSNSRVLFLSQLYLYSIYIS